MAEEYKWPAVLIRIELQAESKAGYFNFQAPLPLPDSVAQFDCDAYSEEMLVTHLAESLRNAPAAALWIKAQGIMPLGAAASLLETLLRHSGPKLLLLEGKHPTLERMGRRLAEVNAFRQSDESSELLRAAQEFFASAESPANSN
jgi:hypothetical protein